MAVLLGTDLFLVQKVSVWIAALAWGLLLKLLDFIGFSGAAVSSKI